MPGERPAETLLYRNLGNGRFGDITAAAGPGLEPPALLRNALLVAVVGTNSNRSGIGARVTVEAGGRRQIDEVRSRRQLLFAE